MKHRPLGPDEAALWARVMAGVRPIAGRAAAGDAAFDTIAKPFVSGEGSPERGRGIATPVRPSASTVANAMPDPASRPRSKRTEGGAANTLDGTWDRQLARGVVSPDRTVDLHGHTLASAHGLLDASLDSAIRTGDRVILLVTGKPPRTGSERPHARGAIRAATGDWLAGSRHAAAIAAVRPAHPRHGGVGALYIVLKRPRTPQKS